MTYESWRCTFQSSEHAARSAYQQILELHRISEERLAVLKDLQESAAYWSEYDVPIGIVERINDVIAKAQGAQLPTAKNGD